MTWQLNHLARRGSEACGVRCGYRACGDGRDSLAAQHDATPTGRSAAPEHSARLLAVPQLTDRDRVLSACQKINLERLRLALAECWRLSAQNGGAPAGQSPGVKTTQPVTRSKSSGTSMLYFSSAGSRGLAGGRAAGDVGGRAVVFVDAEGRAGAEFGSRRMARGYFVRRLV